MATNKIRWQDNDIKKLDLAIKRYNQKIDYWSKKAKNPISSEFLPKKVKKSELIKDIGSRQDLNRKINSLSRFSKKGAEKPQFDTKLGITASKYLLDEARIQNRNRNIKRAYERKKLEHTQEIGVSKKELELSKKQPKKLGSFKSNKEFFKFISSAEKEMSKASYIQGLKNYRNNYFKGLQVTMGQSQIEKIKKIYEMTKNMSDDDFFNKTVSNPFLNISFMYDDLQEINDRIDSIYENWLDILNIK